MPEFCTCGAQLPPDALFCHKCGKPQREIVEPEPPPAPVTLPEPPVMRPPAPAEFPPLNFHNGIALRIALGVAFTASLLFFLPYVNSLAAGFFAVYFYRRRTGHLLNMESGVKMGWMTGLFMFVMFGGILGLAVLALNAIGGVAGLQAQLHQPIDPRMLEGFQMLQNGADILKLLVSYFVLITLLSMAGGALGAKVTGRS